MRLGRLWMSVGDGRGEHGTKKKNVATFVTFGAMLRLAGGKRLHKHRESDTRGIQTTVRAVAADALSRGFQGTGR